MPKPPEIPLRELVAKIKAVRDLSRILGKLGFKDLYRETPGSWGSAGKMIPHYGIGLREARMYVERQLSRKAGAAPAATSGIGIVETESNSI